MTDFSLVPVNHQPDFGDASLIPVDHDPFSADGMIQQARTQLESQPQRLATGADLPDAGADSASGGIQGWIDANNPSAAPILAPTSRPLIGRVIISRPAS
jgi:hypothetical protein